MRQMASLTSSLPRITLLLLTTYYLRQKACLTSHSTPVCPTRQPRVETLLGVDTLTETLLSVDTSVPMQISGVRQRRVAENRGLTRHHPGRSWAVARMVPSSGQPAMGRERRLSQFGWDWKMSVQLASAY